MKSVIIYLVCIFLTIMSYGQEFDKVSLANLDSIEKSQGFEKFYYNYSIGVSEDYFPHRKKYILDQPLVYRKALDSIFLEISIYYSKRDSKLRLIEYWWRDTTNSLDLGPQIAQVQKYISDYFDSKGKAIPEDNDHAEKTIWKKRRLNVEMFEVVEGFRVLISWK